MDYWTLKLSCDTGSAESAEPSEYVPNVWSQGIGIMVTGEVVDSRGADWSVSDTIVHPVMLLHWSQLFCSFLYDPALSWHVAPGVEQAL
ncbi:hypothetical protein KIPB_012827 [Kipferlia bialata]|uniref:Uncharacterized protein n=1 Tax=Kipferlia bialata TaxID=797122 RepID=A0A391NTU0_9EUKA|nr:hypothetical protein KIPB_012827 [Kipferlia bialata]|eukprot:g12827.t1